MSVNSNFSFIVKIVSLVLQTFHTQVRLQFLTVMSMKVAVFWDAMPCSLVVTDQRSEVLTPMTIVLVIGAVRSPETSVSFYQTTWHGNKKNPFSFHSQSHN
jgi:hypothetical protein